MYDCEISRVMISMNCRRIEWLGAMQAEGGLTHANLDYKLRLAKYTPAVICGVRKRKSVARDYRCNASVLSQFSVSDMDTDIPNHLNHTKPKCQFFALTQIVNICNYQTLLVCEVQFFPALVMGCVLGVCE